jgi:hypothetical protein
MLIFTKQTLGPRSLWLTEKCGDPSKLSYHQLTITKSHESSILLSTITTSAPLVVDITVPISLTSLLTPSLPIPTTKKTSVFTTSTTIVTTTTTIITTEATTFTTEVIMPTEQSVSLTTESINPTSIEPENMTAYNTASMTISNKANITVFSSVESINNDSQLPAESLTTGYVESQTTGYVESQTTGYSNDNNSTSPIPENITYITPESEIEKSVSAKIGWFQLVISTGLLAGLIISGLIIWFKTHGRNQRAPYNIREYFMEGEGEAHEMVVLERFQPDPEFYQGVNPFNNDGSFRLNSFANEHHELQPVRPAPAPPPS